MKQKLIEAYMDTAERFAKLSSASRLQVGAIIVKDDRIISIGYNGMPAGWDNNCEYKDYCIDRDMNGNYFPGCEEHYPFEEEIISYYEDETAIKRRLRYALKTKPEVLHAETNAIAKLARSTESGVGASLFVTHSPCLDCAKLIYQSGITSVYYRTDYRSSDGIKFLEKSGVQVQQII